MADMAEGALEEGGGGLGGGVRASAGVGVDGVDDGIPAGVANKVAAAEDDDQRDVLGYGRLATAVDAKSGRAGEAMEGGDNGGRRWRSGEVQRRDRLERGWRRWGGNGGVVGGGGGGGEGRRGCRAADDLVQGGEGGGARREVQFVANRAARVMAAEQRRPMIGRRGAKVVAVVSEAIPAHAGREAVVGVVGEDVGDRAGVVPEGLLVSAVGPAVGVDGVGGGVGGDDGKRLPGRAEAGDGDGGERLLRPLLGSGGERGASWDNPILRGGRSENKARLVDGRVKGGVGREAAVAGAGRVMGAAKSARLQPMIWVMASSSDGPEGGGSLEWEAG